jgi:tetratricopeptide (TPR) repeat protein
MRLFGKTIILLLALALLATGATHASAAKSARKQSRTLYKKGLWAFRAGNTDEAIAKFTQAAQLAPDFPHPLLALGRLHQTKFESTMHGYPEAVQAYESLTLVLIANPPSDRAKDLLQAYYYQGLLYLKGGEYAKALQALYKFIDLYPDFDSMAQVHNSIGVAHYYLDQYGQAVASFKRALENDAALSEARFNLRSVFIRVTAYNEALALHRGGEHRRALVRLVKLRALAPRYLPGRKLEANLLSKLGNPDRALKVLNEVLGFYPNHPDTFHLRIDMARLLIQLERNAQARDILFENLSRFPQHEDRRAMVEISNLLAQTAAP